MDASQGRLPNVIEIVEAGPAAIDAVVGLARAFYAEEGRPLDEALLRRALAGLLSTDAFFGRVLLLQDESEAVGYVVLTLGYSLEFGRDSFIDELYVRPSHRGQGLGGRALAEAEAVGRKLGVRAIHLEVADDNHKAQGLYDASGFEHRGYHLMTKRL
jgi:ribosomal protein S18 acetylase RimI-like enzyme